MTWSLSKDAEDTLYWIMGYTHKKGLLLMQERPGEAFLEVLRDWPKDKYSLKRVAERALKIPSWSG